MAVAETVLTTAGGALSVTVGVVMGAVLTRRAQDRHWLRDQQLAAYQDVLNEYAKFAIILKSAHWAKSDWHYDWAVWSAALVRASLVAPREVATALGEFGKAVNEFLGRAGVDARTVGLTEAEFEQSMVGPARAQVALVNAIRRSLDRDQHPLDGPLGGSLAGKAQI